MGKGQGFEMFCNKQNPIKDYSVSHRTFKSTLDIFIGENMSIII